MSLFRNIEVRDKRPAKYFRRIFSKPRGLRMLLHKVFFPPFFTWAQKDYLSLFLPSDGPCLLKGIDGYALHRWSKGKKKVHSWSPYGKRDFSPFGGYLFSPSRSRTYQRPFTRASKSKGNLDLGFKFPGGTCTLLRRREMKKWDSEATGGLCSCLSVCLWFVRSLVWYHRIF